MVSDQSQNERVNQNHADRYRDSHPGAIPSSPIVWPADRHQSNQIQQVKGTAKAQAGHINPSTQPSVPSVAARTTPRKVSGVRVVLRSTTNGQKQVTVQFAHPSGDPYFQSANVYLRQAGKQPVLVAGGASPVTFSIARNSAPHSIFVTSVGPWGETQVMDSPSAPARLG